MNIKAGMDALTYLFLNAFYLICLISIFIEQCSIYHEYSYSN